MSNCLLKYFHITFSQFVFIKIVLAVKNSSLQYATFVLSIIVLIKLISIIGFCFVFQILLFCFLL